MSVIIYSYLKTSVSVHYNCIDLLSFFGSVEEIKSYGFGTTWEWVNDDRNFTFELIVNVTLKVT